MLKNVLIIGGTGILGKSIISEALKENLNITVLGLSNDKSISKLVKQAIIDRKDTKKFKSLAIKLNKEAKRWDIVIDIADFEESDARQTYTCFKETGKHFFILSTVLVYDRSKPYRLPIMSSHPLAKLGELGGYVDNKSKIEHFWQSVKDVNWTILRPYHILSPTDSLLGCIPDHNRDPLLIERISKNKKLVLCNKGNIEFNFIDARDLAKIILNASGNKKTFHKTYNAVNPTKILAKDYYELIGKELGKKILIENKTIKEVWKDNKGWQLTTLPHIYDVSDLRRDISFVPSISLEQSLKEAVKTYRPVKKSLSEISVHQRMTLYPRPKPIDWLLDLRNNS